MDIAFPTLRSDSSTTIDRRRAATALSFALLAGSGTQALFWRTGLGLNFFAWDILVVGGSVAVFRRGAISQAAWAAIAACLWLGMSVVRFESAWALAIAVPASLAILTALPMLLGARFTISDLSRLPARALDALAYSPRAAAQAARVPGIAVGGEGRVVLRGVVRGLALGLPTAGLFTLLLASDTDFAHSLGRVRDQIGDVVLFGAWSVASAAAYLFTHALHVRPTQPSPIATYEAPYRTSVLLEGAEVGAPLGRVSVVTWAMVVGQVGLVFALFVAANFRHLFGGRALVQAPGALTYATYLHAGFAELLFATILSVCLVLAGHALLRPRHAGSAAMPVPGGRLLTTLEAALLVLTGITVASCWQRLRIYEDAYGASHLRLGVAFVELAVLGVLALTLAKVLVRRWTGHFGAVLAFAALWAVVASGFNADAYVALTNLDRAAAGKALDLEYLGSLSGDARVALRHPYIAANPRLSAMLASQLCAPREGGLRAFRGVGRCEQESQ